MINLFIHFWPTSLRSVRTQLTVSFISQCGYSLRHQLILLKVSQASECIVFLCLFRNTADLEWPRNDYYCRLFCVLFEILRKKSWFAIFYYFRFINCLDVNWSILSQSLASQPVFIRFFVRADTEIPIVFMRTKRRIDFTYVLYVVKCRRANAIFSEIYLVKLNWAGE